jgi:hypothetical protein
MQKIFENVSELTTRKEYDIAMAYVKKIITEATLNGALANPESDNDYVREIGRIGHLCATYEDAYMQFEHLTVRKRERTVLEYA